MSKQLTYAEQQEMQRRLYYDKNLTYAEQQKIHKALHECQSCTGYGYFLGDLHKNSDFIKNNNK